jgi:hypothetical protein
MAGLNDAEFRLVGDNGGVRIAMLPVNRALGAVVEGFAALAAARGEHERAAEPP